MVSFQGARQELKKEDQKLRVEDYMTRKLITFRPEQTINDVVTILLNKKISGGPVVDENNNLVGIISEGDCLKEVVRSKYNNIPSLSGRVDEFMVKEVITVNPEMDIFEAAAMFLKLKIRRFPVMKEGKLLGQVSQRDIMQAVQNLQNVTW